MVNISLCILAKNEAECIDRCIRDVKPFVNEIIVVDDHSTDGTASIATLAGAVVLPLPKPVSETGFAVAANWMIEQASCEWIFIIDADEIMTEVSQLQILTRFPGHDVWALPRRKWWIYPKVRMELHAYPDWQVRLFKKGSGHFVGEMHVTYKCPNISYAYRGPHIEHLQSENRTAKKVSDRAELYPRLAKIQGVTVTGGDVIKSKVG